MRSVVVTGASSGIGWATTRVLTGHDVHVYASVRRPEDADRLTAAFGDRVTPLVFDVTDTEAVRRAADDVGSRLDGRTLFGLVNNAGIVVSGPLLHLPLAELRRQLEVNVVAQVGVIQAFAPLLGADPARTGPRGRIVNISSVAGRRALPFVGAYAASKHALEGISDSLRRELLLHGIDVIVLAPGSVATPIWDKAEATDVAPYAGTGYEAALRRLGEYAVAQGRRSAPPERVGEYVWTALTARRPRVRYLIVHHRLTNWTIPRLLPPRVFDRLLGSWLGLRPRSAE